MFPSCEGNVHLITIICICHVNDVCKGLSLESAFTKFVIAFSVCGSDVQLSLKIVIHGGK